MIVNCKNCHKEFSARQADINRGWGKFCSKSCKAKVQERRTGQHKAYLQNAADVGSDFYDDIVIDDMDFGASDGGGYYDNNGRPL